MSGVIRVNDLETCRELRRRVVAAIIEGEPVEESVALLAGVTRTRPRAESSGWVDAVGSFWAGVRRRLGADGVPAPSGQVDKTRRVLIPFVDLVVGLPAVVEIAEVGTVDVVDGRAARLAADWAARIEVAAECFAVHHEVRSVMAGLVRARMRLDLGLIRLG